MFPYRKPSWSLPPAALLAHAHCQQLVSGGFLGAYRWPELWLQPLNNTIPMQQEAPARPLHGASHEQPNHYYRFASAQKGAAYEVDELELHILQDPNFSPLSPGGRPFPPRISMRKAYIQLFSPHPIKNTAAWKDAWRRIIPVASQRLTWDLLIKMFDDLDTIVFHSDLRRRVLLKWVDMRLCRGASENIGLTEPPVNWRTQRIKIRMSGDTDWKIYPSRYALGVLLHEMLHAYFMVWCRNDTLESNFEPDKDEGHGVIFTVAARKIERRMMEDLTSDPGQFEYW